MIERAYIAKRHFAWLSGPLELITAATHARQDEHVYRAVITEEEGAYPLAEVDLLNPRAGLYAEDRKQWFCIAFTVVRNGAVTFEPQFVGRVQDWPVSAQGDYVTLRATAEPLDALELREAVLEPARVAPFYDVAFVGSEDPVDRPEINLEARAALVHWDRVTLQPALVSTINAPVTFDMGTLWFGDQLDFSSRPGVPDAISVRLRVNWRQPVRYQTSIDVFGRTMTPGSVADDWPKAGASLGNGYTVLQSDYYEGQYDYVSYEVYHDRSQSGGVGQLGRLTPNPREVVQRLQFVADMSVQVEYEVQRSELIRVDVLWNGQASAPDKRGRVRVINVDVDAGALGLGQPWRSQKSYVKDSLATYAGLLWTNPKAFKSGDTFAADQSYADPDTGGIEPRWIRADPGGDLRFGRLFAGTARGFACIKHMALIGSTAISTDRRHVNTSVTRPLGDTLGIRCSMMGRVEGPAFPGGQVRGKVVGYTLESADEGETATVRLASVPGTGLSPIPDDGGNPEPINRDIYYGTDPDGIYAPARYKDQQGNFYPRASWWPIEYSWPPRMQEDPWGLYVFSNRTPMTDPFSPPGGFPEAVPPYWVSYDFDDGGSSNDGYYFSWPPTPTEYVWGYMFSPHVLDASSMATTMAIEAADEDDDEDPPLTEDYLEIWDGDDWAGFYVEPEGGWGPRPDAAVYPPERAWPPSKEQDSFGYYTFYNSARTAEGFYDEVIAPAGRQPLLTINPYEEPATGWPPKPSWWTRVVDYGGFTFAYDLASWPPQREEGLWGFDRIPPSNDRYTNPEEPENPGNGIVGTLVKPSDAEWDWLILPDVSYGVWQEPYDLFKQEITYSGEEQDYILRSPDHAFWETRAPKPGTPGFSPTKWLPEMETAVKITAKDVSNLSATADFRMNVLWNGPKHVDLYAAGTRDDD